MLARLQNTDFFYLKHGAKQARGTPILIFHGGPGLDHTYLRPWLDSLGDKAELIYFDALGCGRTQGRERMASHTLESAAAAAEALRAHLGVARVVVFGHGFGAYSAQAYALGYPDRTAGLVLCAAAPAFDYPQALMGHAQAHCNQAQLAALMGMLQKPVADDAALRRLYVALLPIYFYRFDPRVGAAMTDLMHFSAAHFNRELFELAGQIDLQAELRKVQTPALVLAGRHDWLMPPAHGAARLAAALAGSELAIFEESGHFPFIEEPVPFCRVVRNFLRKAQLQT